MVAAKRTGQASREAHVKPKQLLGYAVIAFILFFVIKDPTGAAHTINNIGNFLSSVARGFSEFLSSL
jgi:hypothetical protein